ISGAAGRAGQMDGGGAGVAGGAAAAFDPRLVVVEADVGLGRAGGQRSVSLGHGGPYSPVNTGGRLSRKALTASLWSAVSWARAWKAADSSSTSGRRECWPSRSKRLARRTARGGLAATRSARRKASSR